MLVNKRAKKGCLQARYFNFIGGGKCRFGGLENLKLQKMHHKPNLREVNVYLRE